MIQREVSAQSTNLNESHHNNGSDRWNSLPNGRGVQAMNTTQNSCSGMYPYSHSIPIKSFIPYSDDLGTNYYSDSNLLNIPF